MNPQLLPIIWLDKRKHFIADSHQYHHLTNTCLYKKKKKGVPSIGTQNTKIMVSQKHLSATEKKTLHRNMNHLSLLASLPNLENWKTYTTIYRALDILQGWKINRISPHSSSAMCQVLCVDTFYVCILLFLPTTLWVYKVIFKEIDNIIRCKGGR